MTTSRAEWCKGKTNHQGSWHGEAKANQQMKNQIILRFKLPPQPCQMYHEQPRGDRRYLRLYYLKTQIIWRFISYLNKPLCKKSVEGAFVYCYKTKMFIGSKGDFIQSYFTLFDFKFPCAFTNNEATAPHVGRRNLLS